MQSIPVHLEDQSNQTRGIGIGSFLPLCHLNLSLCLSTHKECFERAQRGVVSYEHSLRGFEFARFSSAYGTSVFCHFFHSLHLIIFFPSVTRSTSPLRENMSRANSAFSFANKPAGVRAPSFSEVFPSFRSCVIMNTS